MLSYDFMRLVPAGTTHCLVEERVHRGTQVWAVVAIVPGGASVPLNGYSSKALADSTAAMVGAYLALPAAQLGNAGWGVQDPQGNGWLADGCDTAAQAMQAAASKLLGL